MSFINKIKDFFYEEEEVEVDVPVKEEKKEFRPKRKVKETFEEETPKKKINIYDIEKETKNKSEKKEEVSERDLFKAERTFNFPMDVDDGDFEPAFNEEQIKEPEPTPEVKPVEHVVKPANRVRRSSYDYSNYSSVSSQRPSMQQRKDEKHFTPSPVVSPIYGILDQNYKKEDLEANDKTKEFSFDKKIDFDTIRRKAYAALDDELEKTLEKKKDIFYNMDEEEPQKEVKAQEAKIEEDLKEEFEEAPYKKDEVIITYDEVDSSEVEDEKEDFEVPKLTRSKKNKKEEAMEATMEQSKDLFKIIDDMYKEPEDEEGDEE